MAKVNLTLTMHLHWFDRFIYLPFLKIAGMFNAGRFFNADKIASAISGRIRIYSNSKRIN